MTVGVTIGNETKHNVGLASYCEPALTRSTSTQISYCTLALLKNGM